MNPERDETRTFASDSPAETAIAAATFEHVGHLMALVRACVEDMNAHGIQQWDDVYPDLAAIEADARSGRAFIAWHRGDPVGSFVINEHQDAEYARVGWRFATGPVAVVHRLMVHPAMQGRGVARELMRFAEERAAALGYRAIRLDAFTGNPRALRLYERLGYREAGTVAFRKGEFRCFEKQLGSGAPVE